VTPHRAKARRSASKRSDPRAAKRDLAVLAVVLHVVAEAADGSECNGDEG
jgi:hypothetical protein